MFGTTGLAHPREQAYPPDPIQRKRLLVKKGFCHHCGKELEYQEKVFRNDTCQSCGSDLYCCLNCADYDESYGNQCRETAGRARHREGSTKFL